MPSARPSAFKGGAGILRDVDGTITGIQFTDQNPLAGTGKPKPGQKLARKSDFHSLFAVLQVRVDGADDSSAQPIFVGDADAFTVTESGMGVTGEAQFSKSSGWYTFLTSLIGAGYSEDDLGVVNDEDPNEADYSGLVGARVRFNWQVNERATKKYGQKESKGKDGKVKKYDREDLIVTAYHGKVDVDEAPAPATTKATTKPATAAKKTAAGKKTAPVVDIAALSQEQVVLALTAAKDNKLTKSKLSVKILSQMANAPEHRDEVRAFIFANAGSIEGVEYDAATETLTLEA